MKFAMKFTVCCLVGIILLFTLSTGLVLGIHALAASEWVQPQTQVARTVPDIRQSVLPILIPGAGAGSGCVIGETDQWYYIGTARHVVAGNTDFLVDWQVATVVAVSEKHDVAILRIPKTRSYRVLQTGEIRLGQTVSAYGYHWANGPLAPELMMSVGRVSCLNFDGFYAANGGLFPGNSGGPLLSESGELLGIASRVPKVWGSPHVTTACFVPVVHLQKLLAGIK